MMRSLEVESEVHRVPLAYLAHRALRVRMEPQVLRGSLSRVNQGTQDQRVFRVLLDYQVQGESKEKKAVKELRVNVVLMDSVSQDHLDLLDLLDPPLIYKICSSMIQMVSSTSQGSGDHQDPWALKACLAELDFLAPEDQRETQALQVSMGQQGIRERRVSQG